MSDGWMHFEQADDRRDPATGERSLSVAVMPEGVCFAVAREGEHSRACTLSWADWDLLAHAVEIERSDL